MKRFYKSLTILLSLVVAIVGAITSFNNYDQVNAVGYNTQLNNDNYTTLAYTGNLFENEVIVLTTDTTTTLQDLWNNELSSGFMSYLNSFYDYEIIGVHFNSQSKGVLVKASLFGAGSYSISYTLRVYVDASSSYTEYSPIGSFTVQEFAPVFSPSLTGDSSITGIFGLIKKVFDFIINLLKSIFGL